MSQNGQKMWIWPYRVLWSLGKKKYSYRVLWILTPYSVSEWPKDVNLTLPRFMNFRSKKIFLPRIMNFRAQISSTAFYEFWYIEWYSTMMSCYHWWFIILPRFMNFRLIFLPRIINFRLKWVYRVSAFTAFYECTHFRGSKF